MATKNPFQGDDYDFFEAARDQETGEIKREMPKAEPKGVNVDTPAAKKSPVVTKEQLAKSGFTNLRDYLNAQRGLTRRDGKAPVMRDSVSTGRGTRAAGQNVAPAKTSAPAAKTAAPAAAPAKKAEPRKPLAKSEGFQRQVAQDESKREQRREFGRRREAERKASDKASMEALRNDPKQKELRAKREADSKMSPADRSAARGKKVKEFLGFAKGGTVSARADGIAKRGKTKCKII